jgi:hypothetical protein
MPQPSPRFVPPPPLVALASWVVPGLGYVLIGQRKRAVTVGVTVVLLFVLGLLIGGIRVLEVPGYSDNGRSIRLVTEELAARDALGRARFAERVEEAPDPRADPPRVERRRIVRDRWIMLVRPLDQLRAKPWSIAQILNGPVGLLGMAWSVRASVDPDGPRHPDGPAAVPSHSRVNEIGVLYTAVAGMLNLLAVLDAAARAGQAQEQREAAAAPGAGAPAR